jgi:hypothetical protein
MNDSGSLVSLDISGNELYSGWFLNPGYAANPDSEYKFKHTDQTQKQDEDPGSLACMDGVIALTVAIQAMGALAKLTFGDSPDEFNEEATEEWLQSRGTSFEQLQQHFEEPADEQPVTIAAMIFNAVAKAGLPIDNQDEAKASLIAACITSGSVTIDTTMTEADFSGRKLGAAGAQILAAFMSTELFEAKGSLSKLNFSGDSPQSKPVTVEVGMTEADFSGAVLQSSGVIILAAWLEHKVQPATHTNSHSD